jgi:hypothetical protein
MLRLAHTSTHFMFLLLMVVATRRELQRLDMQLKLTYLGSPIQYLLSTLGCCQIWT